MSDQIIEPENYTTKEYADLAKVKEQTVLKNHCLNGHFLGVRPFKLVNRHLLWPGPKVRAALRGGINNE